MTEPVIKLEYTLDEALMKNALLAGAQPGREAPKWLAALSSGVVTLLIFLVLTNGVEMWLVAGFILTFVLGFSTALRIWWLSFLKQIRVIMDCVMTYAKAGGSNTDRLSSDGVRISTDHGEGRFSWQAISEVLVMKGDTGLRLGAQCLPSPDSAFSVGMTPEAFRAQLNAWKAA